MAYLIAPLYITAIVAIIFSYRAGGVAVCGAILISA
jgi:hypothetical protein